ncbi:MAG: amidase [Candidatus Binatus sp.]|jgi:Asp-tRNA(Asn)/Glu-tRNA(Gln) amidotransferase A subunit family amidase
MLDPFIDAWELRDLLIKGEVRPRDVADFYLARIERLNPELGAYMTVTADRALADAARVEASRADTASMKLYGVPYSLKDLTPTAGIRTTIGSRNYADSFPPQDAAIAKRLQGAGGILLGKTTTPEFGGRPTTEGGLCPTARNPWNLAYNAGGSSGGAAAAVAAGLSPLAEGSDGGGSIRGPASNCGVVGLKPSRGRISYAPHRGEAWGGYATRGPLARSVRDVAMMLDVIAGPEIGDPYWAPPPSRPFEDAVQLPAKNLRLASIATSKLGEVDPDVTAAFESACATMREMGHRVEPLDLDPGAMLVDCTRILICVGIAAIPVTNLDWVDPVVREMYEFGRKVIGADYVNLLVTMHNIARTIVERLEPYDALLTPTMTRTAMRNGTFPSRPERYLDELWTWIAFEYPFNATGQPAVTIPAGFDRAGLPIGFQIVGRPNGEFELLTLAAAFESARPWRHLRPPLPGA